MGTFIWQLLVARGGGPAADAYDPRPRPEPVSGASVPARAPRPPLATGDITGPERVALCEEGIHELQRAVELRPHYPDALTYIGLLYRQESFASWDDLPAWERAVAQASTFSARAAEKP